MGGYRLQPVRFWRLSGSRVGSHALRALDDAARVCRGTDPDRALARRFDSLPGYGRDVDSRTETQSIESPVDPRAIVALLEDPSRIPDWAPAFADAVTGDTQSGWRIMKSGQDFALRVVVMQDAGTVDYLREIAPGREGGAYIRVIPRPRGGSVVVMTVPLAPDAQTAAIAATLRDELNALAALASSS
jgi:Polyketide cyclase / dehydrase and lipid transport